MVVCAKSELLKDEILVLLCNDLALICPLVGIRFNPPATHCINTKYVSNAAHSVATYLVACLGKKQAKYKSYLRPGHPRI